MAPPELLKGRPPPRVLVVEDDPQQAEMAEALLTQAGYEVALAASGEEALAALEHRDFDAVTTDLVMPGMNGIELVERVRADFPLLPVILVTAHGSGRVAAEALRRGAASYVTKGCLRDELASTVESVLSVLHERRELTRILERLVDIHLSFRLENEQELVVPLVNYMQERIATVCSHCDQNQLMQIGVALQEAILNAMHHGNLEASSELRQESSEAYRRLVTERLGQVRFAGRRVSVEAWINRERVEFRIVDEGPGFDHRAVPDPTDPENLLKASGRGLYLINAFMDEVRHNEAGNEIRLVKRLGAGQAA